MEMEIYQFVGVLHEIHKGVVMIADDEMSFFLAGHFEYLFQGSRVMLIPVGRCHHVADVKNIAIQDQSVVFDFLQHSHYVTGAAVAKAYVEIADQQSAHIRL
jgi:hypothetical protein